MVCEKEYTCTPYLMRGNAHLLLLLFLFREKFKNDCFRAEEEKLLHTIVHFFEVKASFWEGTTGLIFLLLIASMIDKQTSFLDIAASKIIILDWMKDKKSQLYIGTDGKLLNTSEQELISLIYSCFE